jgi:hypothetical protein
MMFRRHLCLVRALSAAGLLSFLPFAPATAGEPGEPLPAAEARAETVKILDAKKAGDLLVDLRGAGQSEVKMTIKNTSARRLNVVLPAGLVAASTVGQGPGGGGGNPLQSMGLGAPGNRPGGFGNFGGNGNGNNAVGFRSVGITAESNPSAVVVPAGKAVELQFPAVCLNFGLPSPTARDRLTLVDIDDHTRDPRVRKALRSLGTLGTSQGTAQAVMWNVCNNVPFETMLAQGEKVVNRHEVVLAARFLEALDASTASEIVDPTYLTEARVFLTVIGENGMAKDAHRVSTEMEGLRILGLPVRVSVAQDLPRASAPALHLLVSLVDTKGGETSGKILVRHTSGSGEEADWVPLGHASFKEASGARSLKGVDLARTIDHAVAAAFVTAKPTHKAVGSTTMKIENRLPFSLVNVTLRAGSTPTAPAVTFTGLGIGPARSGLATLQAPTGTVDRVELNGL